MKRPMLVTFCGLVYELRPRGFSLVAKVHGARLYLTHYVGGNWHAELSLDGSPFVAASAARKTIGGAVRAVERKIRKIAQVANADRAQTR